MWALDPAVRHLNHGSFGAVPIEVLEAQSTWRRRWETNTTTFVQRDLPHGLARARSSAAKFIGANEENLAFVRNASTGVASVVRSIEPLLEPGDELLTTAQDYNAVRQTLEFTAERFGAEVVVAPVPFPVESPDEVTEAIVGSVTPRTKLAVIDHITSPTALVFPIEDIVRRLEPETAVLVDGAHGPGQIPLDVEALGASWYTGNLHKWTCVPKGAAFLHARSDRRDMTIPTVVSHGWNMPVPEGSNRFQALFDWLGTDDFSQWLVVPDALAAVERLEPGGWPAVMKRNHELILAARRLVADALGFDLPAPDEMIGTMASISLTDARGVDPGGEISPLMGELIDAGFETLVMIWPRWPSQLLRISAHHYNQLEEYSALAEELARRWGEEG